MENIEQTPLNIKKTEADILYREAEIKEKLKNINFDAKKYRNEEVKTLIEKVDTLRCLLESHIVDEERQIPGCEIILKNTFSEKEIYTIKNKMFELIKKF